MSAGLKLNRNCLHFHLPPIMAALFAREDGLHVIGDTEDKVSVFHGSRVFLLPDHTTPRSCAAKDRQRRAVLLTSQTLAPIALGSRVRLGVTLVGNARWSSPGRGGLAVS